MKFQPIAYLLDGPQYGICAQRYLRNRMGRAAVFGRVQINLEFVLGAAPAPMHQPPMVSRYPIHGFM